MFSRTLRVFGASCLFVFAYTICTYVGLRVNNLGIRLQGLRFKAWLLGPLSPRRQMPVKCPRMQFSVARCGH